MRKGLLYRGDTEEDRMEAAVMFDRIEGMIQRFGQSITPNEREAFEFCIRVLIEIPEEQQYEEQPAPAPAAAPGTARPTPPEGERPPRKLRAV